MTQPLDLFVYGTLMKGEHHHGELASAEFLGAAETEAAFELLLIDYYPALVRGGSSKVIGELYRVDAATLKRLDELEEVPHYYVREPVLLADGRTVHTYLMPRERAAGGSPIDSGYFRMRTAPPKRR